MEPFLNAQNLKALSTLLSPPQEEEESDEEECENVSQLARLGPGHIGAASFKAGKEKKADNVAYTQKTLGQGGKIWDVDEVPEESHFDDLSDPRPQPEYEIILKQTVGTEDLFLGMSRKDPSSSCCESILVKVKLPETKTSEVELDVKETFLDLRTPKYKLGLHLPYPVHSSEGTARFITEKAELEITLPMNRPLDCINLA